MSRQLRLEHPGAIWHVTSRGNERRDIYRDDQDRRRFLSLLSRVVRERRWCLHAWVLMSNHYHLLVETPEVGLSRGMKWLNQRYVETFNQRHGRVGHLFQGRFKGILVERASHLLELLRYIVLNPVRCGSVRYAGDYDWSNYRATAGLCAAPPWLTTEWTLMQFGSCGDATAEEEYRRFVADGRGASYAPWEQLTGQIYLGGAGFCERMQMLVRTSKRSREHPRLQREFVRPSLDALVALVAESFGVDVESVLRRSRRSSARKALVELAIAEGGLSGRMVADRLGITAAAVSKMRVASQELSATDAEHQERLDRIRAALS